MAHIYQTEGHNGLVFIPTYKVGACDEVYGLGSFGHLAIELRAILGGLSQILCSFDERVGLSRRPLHLKELPFDGAELPISNECVSDCGNCYYNRANDIGLGMDTATSESLPPSFFQKTLLLFIGLFLMAVGGFCALCIFLFKASGKKGMIALFL
jgi:hypothetical protein